MVIEDPDSYDLEEYKGIEIFEPGSQIEREVDWDNLFQVLVYTGGAFGLTMGLFILIMIPFLVTSLIIVNMNTLEMWFGPWTFLILSISEIGFVVPPMIYARRRGLPLSSIGWRSSAPVADVALGLLAGMAMLVANILITGLVAWLVDMLTGVPISGTGSLFVATSPQEIVAWIVVMFVVIGFSEETVFRGFLQRRMEIYFRGRSLRYRGIAITITSLIFAVIHLDPLGIPSLFVLSLFLGYLAQKRGYSVLGPAVAHGFNNAVVVVLASFGF